MEYRELATNSIVIKIFNLNWVLNLHSNLDIHLASVCSQ